MAKKFMTSSGSIGTSGANTSIKRIVISGNHATEMGSISIQTGGSGGTVVVTFYVQAGDTIPIRLPNLVGDYISLTNCNCLVEYYK